MTAINFIIHGITKAKGANPAIVQTRDTALPLDDNARKFVDTAFELFRRQTKGLLFADFVKGGAKEVFQNYLSAYFTQKTLAFVDFSKLCVRHLADTMQPVNFATGGFLIFVEAEGDGAKSLCILLLSQEMKFAVDEKDLSLMDVPALNLDKMGVGCSISLGAWAGNVSEPVSYVRGSREISEYFMRFIGARPNKAPKDASKEIAAFSENFLAEKKIDGPEQAIRLRRLYDYCKKQSRSNEPVDLSIVGSIVFQENQDAFFQAANSSGISSEFHVDERYLKALLQIEYKAKGVSLMLSRSAVRDRVRVDIAKKELTIQHVDESTLKEISEALGT